MIGEMLGVGSALLIVAFVIAALVMAVKRARK